MQKLIYLGLLLLVVNGVSKAQSAVTRIASNVCVIEFTDSSQLGFTRTSTGTGTFIWKAGKDTSSLFLVTNKHCLPKFGQATTILLKVRSTSTSSVGKIIPFAVFESNSKISSKVRFADNGEDVAVIDVSTLYPSIGKEFVPSNILLATKDTLKKYEIGLGKDIFFLGFPSVFYDKRNYSPILRSGIIATDPTQDFYYNSNLVDETAKRFKYVLPEKLNGFLIDASAFGGSSGRLVFVKPQPFEQREGNRAIPTIPLPFILGILTESHNDIGSDSTVAMRLNLGGVISAEIIKNTIDDFFAKIHHTK